MFQDVNPVAAPDEPVDKDGLRRVGWPELAAAISHSRGLGQEEEEGLLDRVGPIFDRAEAKEQRGVNLSSLARRKSPWGNAGSTKSVPPRRDREKP